MKQLKMRKTTILAACLMVAAAATAQTYRLTDMTAETFAAGGDAQWSFEKYAFSSGVYSKFVFFTDSSTCNYVDVYQPERVGGQRITEIDGVTAAGEYTWASNVRSAWCDAKYVAPARTGSMEKFAYVCRDGREGYGFELYGNRDYASVVSFTVPADGFYKVDGSVIRQDCGNLDAIHIVPRYRFATATDKNLVDSRATMGLSFAYGDGGGQVANYDGKCRLADGASQLYVAQTARPFTMAFQGKKGDVISFEVNVQSMKLTSDWARDAFGRTFLRTLDVQKVDESAAKADSNFADPYDTGIVQALMALLDDYQSQAGDMVVGSNYGQYPQTAMTTFLNVCEAIGKAYDAGAINSMNAVSYQTQLETAWKALTDSKIVNDFAADGNYRLFYYDANTSSVVYDADVMAKNDDSPWGFFAYAVSTGSYTKMANHDTGSKFGNTLAAWYNKASDWFYIADNGNLHPMPSTSPAIVFTAQKDGVYKVDFSCYRPNPNTKVENPLYIRCRFMDAATTTCDKGTFIFAKQYGSVANDGQKGKAPIAMDYFVQMKKGDKITFEEDCYTANSNASAGTQITALTICSCVNADSVYTVAAAKASGLDFYNPYGAGDATALKAETAYADSVAKAHASEIGSDGGQYPQEAYNTLTNLVTEAKGYLAKEGTSEATQAVFDKLVTDLQNAVTAFLTSRKPFEKVISGTYSIRLDGTQKFLTQNNSAGAFYYAGFFDIAGVVADAARFSGVTADDYSWTFTFAQNDTIQGTLVTDANGYLCADGYVIAGTNATGAQDNAFHFYTYAKDDNAFAIQRNDGKYWGTSFSWVSPYNKIAVSTTPQYVFVLDTQTITGVKVTSETVKTIASTRYFTLSGIEMNRPAKGVNIVRQTFTDGSSRTLKVLIR
jgi:hypothetical protein